MPIRNKSQRIQQALGHKKRLEKFWYKWLMRSAKRVREGKKLVSVSIDESWILDQFKKQDGKCYWTGVDLKITKIPNHPFKPSLDRLEIKGDYSPKNTVLTALSVNIGRNDNNAIDFKKFIKKIASN